MRSYATIGAITAWLAVIAQFYLIIINRTSTVPETVVRFFSYFTILTNILVALSFTALLLKPKSQWRNFFSRPDVLTAVAVYITIVGLVYNMILRALWQPEGLQRLVDELLHTVVPLLFIVFWCIYVSRHALRWKQIASWLLYPFVYFLYVLIRGALSGFYPYPFINVREHGYGPVLLNSLYIMCAFLFFSALFVAVGKIRQKALS
jgi:hypothetical protein